MIFPSGFVCAIHRHGTTDLDREYIACNTLIVKLEIDDGVVFLGGGCGIEVIGSSGIEKAVERGGQGLLRRENAAGVTFVGVTEIVDGMLVLGGAGGVEVVDGCGLVCSEEWDSQTTFWAGEWWWWRWRTVGAGRWPARSLVVERRDNTWVTITRDPACLGI